MSPPLTLDTICAPSDDIVGREIEGEIVIVPLVAGIGDADDELYTLNDTGRAIWQRLDGMRAPREVAASLLDEFETSETELEADVLSFADEMAQRGILAARG